MKVARVFSLGILCGSLLGHNFFHEVQQELVALAFS